MTSDRVGQFEADIAAAPEALTRLLDGWQAPDQGGPAAARLRPGSDIGVRSRIAFAGLGSSRYAAMIVAGHLRASGATAWVEYASSSTPTSPADDLVLIAISASGRTREVLDAADRHRGRSLVVAVTSDPDSPLGAAADVVIPLQAGKETAGIACRTFRAAVAALAMLTGAARRDDLRPAVVALAARIAARDAWLPPLVDALDGAPSIDVLADASILGLADQAALMLREAPRLPAWAHDTGDWLHTGVYLAFPGHRALLYPGAAADAEVIDTVRRRGGEIVLVEPSDDRDPIHRALVESVVGELAATELWRRTNASG